MSASSASPLSLGRQRVEREWINPSGHLSAAAFVVIGEKAIAPFLDGIGFSPTAIASSGTGPILKEMHVTYQREALAGQFIAIDLMVLAVGEKSAHAFMTLRADGDLKVATLELAIIKLDLKAKRAARWTGEEQARRFALARAHAALPRPAEAGRAIRFEPIPHS